MSREHIVLVITHNAFGPRNPQRDHRARSRTRWHTRWAYAVAVVVVVAVATSATHNPAVSRQWTLSQPTQPPPQPQSAQPTIPTPCPNDTDATPSVFALALRARRRNHSSRRTECLAQMHSHTLLLPLHDEPTERQYNEAYVHTHDARHNDADIRANTAVCRCQQSIAKRGGVRGSNAGADIAEETRDH